MTCYLENRIYMKIKAKLHMRTSQIEFDRWKNATESKDKRRKEKDIWSILLFESHSCWTEFVK